MIRILTLLLIICTAGAEDLTPIEQPKDYVQVYAISGYRVVDGDTIEVRLELGQGLTRTVSIRLIGIDTPETNRTAQKVAGLLVEQVVVQWMASQESLLCDYHSDDKYNGRIDGDLRPIEGQSLSSYLIEHQLGRVYDGGTREDWTDERLQAIADAASALIEEPNETP